MKFRDIPQMSQANYAVSVSWSYLESWLDHNSSEGTTLEMDPEYQRGYVWSDEQKTAYCEYTLKGGMSGQDIFWNCASWMKKFDSPVEIVDGKQRISAVLDFLHNKIKVFGHYYKDFEDRLDPIEPRFTFHVNDLEDPIEVVQWYLDMNTGGSIHTEKDLKPAREMLARLKGEK